MCLGRVPLPWLANPTVWGMEFRFLCQNRLLLTCSPPALLPRTPDALPSCHFQTTTVLHEVLFCVCIYVSVLFAWNSPHLLWGLRNCSSFTWTVVSLPKFSLNVTFSFDPSKICRSFLCVSKPSSPCTVSSSAHMSVCLPPRMMSSASLCIWSSSLWLTYSRG